MKNYINEHGIIIGGDEIIVVDDNNCFAAVTVAQHPGTGKWAYGIDVRAGGISVDSFGFSYAPSVRRAKYATRDDALDAAMEAVERRYTHHEKWASACGRKPNPVVGKAVQTALVQLARGRQLSLF